MSAASGPLANARDERLLDGNGLLRCERRRRGDELGRVVFDAVEQRELTRDRPVGPAPMTAAVDRRGELSADRLTGERDARAGIAAIAGDEIPRPFEGDAEFAQFRLTKR